MRAESEIERLERILSDGGLAGLAGEISSGGLRAPVIAPGDSVNGDQAAVGFGRALLGKINALAASNDGAIDRKVIVSVMTIGDWIMEEVGYGNLVISHRALDVSGGLTIRAICNVRKPPSEMIALGSRISNGRIEPIYRARIIDAALGGELFSDAVSAAGEEGERAVRKLWKNLCFLGYCAGNPNMGPELAVMKTGILASLGGRAAKFESLAKGAPAHVLASENLRMSSSALFERRNLWFVSMASAPETGRQVGWICSFLEKVKEMPVIPADASEEAVKEEFGAIWQAAGLGDNPGMARTVGEIVFRCRKGHPLDRDATLHLEQRAQE